MNEFQHDLRTVVTAAEFRVHLAATALEKARLELTQAQLKLDQAVKRDPQSWYGTPGISGP